MNIKEFFNDLDNLLVECKDSDWDIEGSNPIAISTVEKVKKFINNLPEKLLFCEFAPCPDGDISIDWYVDRNNVLSLSISEYSNVIPWVLVEGSSSSRGVDCSSNFEEGSISKELLEKLDKIEKINKKYNKKGDFV